MKKGPRGRAGGTAFTLSSRHLDLATPSRGWETLLRPEAAVSLPPEAWPGSLRQRSSSGVGEGARHSIHGRNLSSARGKETCGGRRERYRAGASGPTWDRGLEERGHVLSLPFPHSQ